MILLLCGTDSSWSLHHSFSLFPHRLRYHVNNASYPLVAFPPLIWTAFLSFHCCLISCVACRYRLNVTYLGWAWVGCQVAHNSRCCVQNLLPGRRLAWEQEGHRDWHSYSNADLHFKALPAYMTRQGSSCQMIRVSAWCCAAPCSRVYSQNTCVSADNRAAGWRPGCGVSSRQTFHNANSCAAQSPVLEPDTVFRKVGWWLRRWVPYLQSETGWGGACTLICPRVLNEAMYRNTGWSHSEG